MAKETFVAKLANVAWDANLSIMQYKGKRLKTLPTGEKAIDNDDAWIIIAGHEDTDDEPVLRDKRAKDNRNDVYLYEEWDYMTICEFADSLMCDE